MCPMTCDTVGKNLCQVRGVAIEIVLFHHAPPTCDAETMAQRRVVYQALDSIG